MTEIKWKADWKPSELELDGSFYLRGKQTGDIIVAHENHLPTNAERRFDLGPRIRPDDSARVAELEAEVGRLRKVLGDIQMDSAYKPSRLGAAVALGAIARKCDAALTPKPKEAGS